MMERSRVRKYYGVGGTLGMLGGAAFFTLALGHENGSYSNDKENIAACAELMHDTPTPHVVVLPHTPCADYATDFANRAEVVTTIYSDNHIKKDTKIIADLPTRTSFVNSENGSAKFDHRVNVFLDSIGSAALLIGSLLVTGYAQFAVEQGELEEQAQANESSRAGTS